jgi:hypothetical protein
VAGCVCFNRSCVCAGGGGGGEGGGGAAPAAAAARSAACARCGCPGWLRRLRRCNGVVDILHVSHAVLMKKRAESRQLLRGRNGGTLAVKQRTYFAFPQPTNEALTPARPRNEYQPIASRLGGSRFKLRAAPRRSVDKMRAGCLGNATSAIGRASIDQDRLLHDAVDYGRNESGEAMCQGPLRIEGRDDHRNHGADPRPPAFRGQSTPLVARICS